MITCLKENGSKINETWNPGIIFEALIVLDIRSFPK